MKSEVRDSDSNLAMKIAIIRLGKESTAHQDAALKLGYGPRCLASARTAQRLHNQPNGQRFPPRVAPRCPQCTRKQRLIGEANKIGEDGDLVFVESQPLNEIMPSLGDLISSLHTVLEPLQLLGGCANSVCVVLEGLRDTAGLPGDLDGVQPLGSDPPRKSTYVKSKVVLTHIQADTRGYACSYDTA